MMSQTYLQAVVIELSRGATPGFYFFNSLGKRCYCFDTRGDEGFRELKPGQFVKVAGTWSAVLSDVFEGAKVLSRTSVPF